MALKVSAALVLELDEESSVDVAEALSEELLLPERPGRFFMAVSNSDSEIPPLPSVSIFEKRFCIIWLRSGR
jgi:hypothetical protein